MGDTEEPRGLVLASVAGGNSERAGSSLKMLLPFMMDLFTSGDLIQKKISPRRAQRVDSWVFLDPVKLVITDRKLLQVGGCDQFRVYLPLAQSLHRMELILPLIQELELRNLHGIFGRVLVLSRATLGLVTRRGRLCTFLPFLSTVTAQSAL